MLNASGIESQMIQLDDFNQIDREVTERNPTDVIVEAFWVTPQKLNELIALKRHQGRRWFVRGHSELPFLSNEGMAFSWLIGYLDNPDVTVTANTDRMVRDLRALAQSWFPHWAPAYTENRILTLPNYYPLPAPLPRVHSLPGQINIGCFGAIRPLKNQFIQAVAALDYAVQVKKHLIFHINGERIEGGGENIRKNLQAIFNASPNADLVSHPWMTRPEFLDLCRKMDLGMQVSFSETFNIVTADFVTTDIPVVVSPEITWISPHFQANPTDSSDIVSKIGAALRANDYRQNRKGLIDYNSKSQLTWLQLFGRGSNQGWWPSPDTLVARPAITTVRTHG